jgi:hypothetical protein
MKKELLIVILAVVGIIGVSILLKYVIFGSARYTAKPLMVCVQCIDSATWNNQPCCDSAFSQQCADKNGVIRFKDLRPDFSGLLQECYMIAPDAGKECGIETDCKSGFCDLENAIRTNKCILREKRGTTILYFCSSESPGVCAPAPESTPDTALHHFRMEARNLIETQ